MGFRWSRHCRRQGNGEAGLQSRSYRSGGNEKSIAWYAVPLLSFMTDMTNSSQGLMLEALGTSGL